MSIPVSRDTARRNAMAGKAKLKKPSSTKPTATGEGDKPPKKDAGDANRQMIASVAQLQAQSMERMGDSLRTVIQQNAEMSAAQSQNVERVMTETLETMKGMIKPWEEVRLEVVTRDEHHDIKTATLERVR